MCARGLLVASLVLALSAPVLGRGGGGGGRGGPNGENGGRGDWGGNAGQLDSQPVTQDGTVEKIVPGGVVMTTKDGPAINVVVGPATKLHLTGSATADFIKAGVAVEFTAELDMKYTAKEKVTSLTAITLTAERRAGLFPQGAAGAGPAAQNNFGFPAGGDGVADPAPAEKGAKKAEKPKAADAVKLPGTFVVRGTVRSYKDGELTVKTGKGTVKAALADDVQIAVNLAEISHAKKGDAIAVRGRGPRQGQQGQQGTIQADSVTIQAAAPLTGPKKAAPKEAAASKDGPGDAPRLCRPPSNSVRIGESKRGGLSQFSFDENGTVPL